jgi:hypothetical protein
MFNKNISINEFNGVDDFQNWLKKQREQYKKIDTPKNINTPAINNPGNITTNKITPQQKYQTIPVGRKNSKTTPQQTNLTFPTEGKNNKCSDWISSSNYWQTSDGKNLQQLASPLVLQKNTGFGGKYDPEVFEKNVQNPKVWWSVFDINNNRFLAESKDSNKNVFAASVSKVCVASAALSVNNGTLPTDKDLNSLIKLLVVSDNDVWSAIQDLAGGGEAVLGWAKSMGFTMKPSRRGGNSCNAHDLALYWNLICKNQIPGSEKIFKLTSACHSSRKRSRLYMPKDVFIGGKTGSYKNSNHDSCWLKNSKGFFSITVLTELGDRGSEIIANLFRGLYNQYCA